MFGLFKSNGKKLPEFKKLNESEIKDKYFYRIASWNWLNEDSISVLDPKSPRMITMDAWPQLVFLEANGQKTIEEFILHMAKQYKKIPNELDEVILHQINQLFKEGLINLNDEKAKLNADFVGPIKK